MRSSIDFRFQTSIQNESEYDDNNNMKRLIGDIASGRTRVPSVGFRLTPWTRDLLEKLIVAQLVQIARTCHFSLS
jgi:hypothetical protein